MKGESRTYGSFEGSLCVVCARVGASYAFVVVARRHGVGSTFTIHMVLLHYRRLIHAWARAASTF